MSIVERLSPMGLLGHFDGRVPFSRKVLLSEVQFLGQPLAKMIGSIIFLLLLYGGCNSQMSDNN